MDAKIEYKFLAVVWQHSSSGGWYFSSLPKEIAKEIRENLKWMEEGWGRLKVTAKTGNSEWKTAIWFDSKHKTYLLPLKLEIRKKENLKIGQEINVVVVI